MDKENDEIRFCGGYDLNDDSLAFNWDNTGVSTISMFWAEELAAANDLAAECGREYRETIWRMLCD